MSNLKKNYYLPEKNAISTKKIIGFDFLKKVLERDFFASANIEGEFENENRISLVIHLQCNFGLTESLFHLNNGNWGNFKNSINGDIKTSPFHTTLVELENDNGMTIDIKELSIHLRDTSIIISRLPNCQIQDQLETILDSVSANFVHFTKGLTKMPYEMFVPIYEETENDFLHSEIKQNNHPDYLGYWGLYFEDEEDTLVYDVKNKVIIEESDFFLLNQWE